MRGATCRERCRAPKSPPVTKVDAEKKRNGNRARRRRRDLESASHTPSRRRETLFRKRRVFSASAHPLPITKTTNTTNAYRLHQSPQLRARGPDVLVLFPSPATSAATTSAATVTAATSSIATVTAAAKTARKSASVRCFGHCCSPRCKRCGCTRLKFL